MNRLKVLLYVVLVTAAGAAAVHFLTRWATERTFRQMDRELALAAAAIQARATALPPEAPAGAEGLRALRRELGVDVTLLSDGRVVQSTLGPGEASLVASAGREAGRPAVAGALEPQRLSPELPVPAPALPLLLARAPALRLLATPGPGGEGLLAVSLPVAAPLAAVITVQWLGLVAVALFALLGLAVALLVTDEQRAVVPQDLLAAADRVARGDFGARAPVMAGRLGTLAAALNRAAEAAASGPRPGDSTGAAPLSPDELADLQPGTSGAGFALTRPPPQPEPGPLGALDEPAAPAPQDVPALAGAEELAPAPSAPDHLPEPALAQPAPAGHDEPTARDFFAAPAPVAVAAGAVSPIAAPAEAAPAAPAASGWPGEDEDEDHWKAVYEDFQRARAESGESRGAVSYERFREKLQKNRDQLVERYACRTVRFQVYVKDGKAALKASPVR